MQETNIKEVIRERTPGRVAYAIYCQAIGAIENTPDFSHLSQVDREAWEVLGSSQLSQELEPILEPMATLSDIAEDIKRCLARLKTYNVNQRRKSLVVTKLEEAYLWAVHGDLVDN